MKTKAKTAGSSPVKRFVQCEPDFQNPVFWDGYMAGTDDPGANTATQPSVVKTPYEDGTENARQYERGYRGAIA